MFVICYGGHKTGSTLCFRLVSALLEYSGHSQADIPASAVTPNRGQNFANGELTQTDTWAEVLGSHSDSKHYFAIKTHGSCSTRVNSLMAAGKVKVVVNTRDPRDVLLSLRDAGKKNTMGAFSGLTSAQRCLDNISKNESNLLGWLGEGSEAFDYHEIAFDSRSFLDAVSQYLQLPVIDDTAHNFIIAKVGKDSIPTLNLGIPHHFLNNMSARQALYYTHLFQNQLELLSRINKRLDTTLEEFYPLFNAYKSITPKKIVTKKTFVVLGCPRGGTSLIAGALAASGIAMGKFRTSQYEDPDFNIRRTDATDINIEAKLLGAIQQRNETHEYWGWKLPNNIYYIEKIRHLLINPVFIFVYRDTEAVARSSAKHDKRNWRQYKARLFEVAKRHTTLIKNYELTVADDSASFEFEDIKKDIDGFIDELAAAISPLEPDSEILKQFVNREGGYSELPEQDAYAKRHYGFQVWNKVPGRSRSAAMERSQIANSVYPRFAENWELVEKDDQFQLNNETTGRSLNCNTSAALILDFCDGELSIREIARLISQAVPDTPSNLIDEVYSTIDDLMVLGAVVDSKFENGP